MADYFEIDFLGVETKKSGDAIALRYEKDGATFIHVVDGGYATTGETLRSHVLAHYDNPKFIDHVVATHNDGDHARGLVAVLEHFEVGVLWMLRPWRYAEELIGRFETYTSVDRLRSTLRSAYANLAALEDIAVKKGIEIREPFQGAWIGAFHVMAPTRARFIKVARILRSGVEIAGRLTALLGSRFQVLEYPDQSFPSTTLGELDLPPRGSF